MAYTDEGKIEKYLLQDIDTSFSATLDDWIAMAKEWIDAYCRTTFESASTDKYYDGGGGQDLFVDEFTGSPTVVILDSNGNVTETLTEGTDFVAYPLNDTVKNIIRFTRGSYGLISDQELIDGPYGNVWPGGTKSVKVTASFGHLTVPKSVEVAASMIVAKIINEGLRGGQVKSESLGGYSVTYQDIDANAAALGIKSLLDPYRVMDL